MRRFVIAELGGPFVRDREEKCNLSNWNCKDQWVAAAADPYCVVEEYCHVVVDDVRRIHNLAEQMGYDQE